MCGHCFDSSCDGYSGVCKKGCVDGWSGLSCHCNPRCKDGCGVDGECLTGCASGWYGNYCAELCLQEGCQECDQMTGNCTHCNSGKYGQTCEKSCQEFCAGSICNIRGLCILGCKKGFSGTFCQSPSADFGSFGKPIIYIITLGVLLFGLFLITTGILIQKKRRQKAAPENTYESTISTHRENAEYDKIQPDPVYHNTDCHVQS
ncbi:multiple epidermal growth factor-like domains protein 10 isoform X2 [Saccostrea cucullata]|uniref:multiple epidermal growth factor-like domains protein 10 isoform X2 n=1 Tax=Saccostrea cuccullata TaxID=36930 RepID=UPI002ED2F60A